MNRCFGFGNDFFSGCSTGSHGSNQSSNVPRNHSQSIAFSGMVANHHSSFGNHVSNVVSLSPEEKMIWPNAKMCIASVKNKLAIGNGSIMDNPRRSMSRLISRHPSPKSDVSITVGPRRSSPYPAWSEVVNMTRDRSILVHFGPEAGSERQGIPLRKCGILFSEWSGHNQVLFDCVSPSAASTARGHLHL